MNVSEISFSVTQTVKADGQNITQDMLNDTIDELKTWILSVLITVEGNLSAEISDIETMLNTSTNDILNRINQASEEICDNMSLLIFGDLNMTNMSNGTMSLISYLDARLNVSGWNVTVSVDDISLEGINESSILGKLNSIYAALGYNNTTATIYDDLTSILTGLVDGAGNYVLRNASGVSSFYNVGALLITSLTNQGTLSANMENATNTTLKKIETEATGIKSNVKTNAEWVAGSSGSVLSLFADVGIIFLILWVFFLKKYLSVRKQNAESYSDAGTNQQQASQQYEQTTATGGGITDRIRNRFGIMSKSDGPPDCYCDGISVDTAGNVYCASCKLSRDCVDAKILYENKKIQEKMNAEKNQQANISDITPGMVKGLSEIDTNLENW